MASDKKIKIINFEWLHVEKSDHPFWNIPTTKSPVLNHVEFILHRSPCRTTCQRSCRKEKSVRIEQEAIAHWSLGKSGLLDIGPAWKELLNKKEAEQTQNQ